MPRCYLQIAASLALLLPGTGNCPSYQDPVAIQLILATRAWVGRVVNIGEMLKIEVGVDLGGGNIGVPEQFLHRAQIRA